MQFPLAGSWTIEVDAARPFTIHGDLYYELTGTRVDDPAAAGPVVLKVPQHATAGEPAAGQTLRVTFLMGQVTGMTLVEG